MKTLLRFAFITNQLVGLGCIYVLAFVLAFPGSRLMAKDIPWELATSRTIPGKNVPAKCMEYAVALHHQMKAAGVKSHVLIFTANPITAPGPEGYLSIRHDYEGHAVCVYYYPNGEVWAMDNQLMRPIRISDGNADHMARVIATPSRSIALAYFADTQDPPVRGWTPGPNYRRVAGK